MMYVYWTECGLSFRTRGLASGPLEWWTGKRWARCLIHRNVRFNA